MSDDEAIRQQRERFIRSFELIGEASANMASVAKKQIETMNLQIDATNKQIEEMVALFNAIMEPKNGLRDAIDDLIDEIHGLRTDIRLVAQAGGFRATLSALSGKKR